MLHPLSLVLSLALCLCQTSWPTGGWYHPKQSPRWQPPNPLNAIEGVEFHAPVAERVQKKFRVVLPTIAADGQMSPPQVAETTSKAAPWRGDLGSPTCREREGPEHALRDATDDTIAPSFHTSLVPQCPADSRVVGSATYIRARNVQAHKPQGQPTRTQRGSRQDF